MNRRISTRFSKLVSMAFALVLLATACSSEAPTTAAEPESAVEDSPLPLRLSNQGGSLEGHTPRTFAGSGVGLFAGDNLNSNFPNGVGIQILLSFDLPANVGQPTQVRLVSDALSERGNAFEALGPLQAEPVTYESFGPPLFELAADGPATDCSRVETAGIECDLTAAATAAIAADASRFQVRLQFATQSDNDGQQDLALFFLTDSNTNEPGIFFLELS